MPKHLARQQSSESMPSDDEEEEGYNHPPRPSRKRDVTLNFAMMVLPILAIPLILLAFVLYTKEHPVFLENAPPELPIIPVNVSGIYTTRISANSFVLVGSWASTVAQFVMAPFMLLFSFIIAKTTHDKKTLAEAQQTVEYSSHRVQVTANAMSQVPWTDVADDMKRLQPEDIVSGISKAVTQDIWEGVKLYIFRRQHTVSRAARIAVAGGVLSTMFTILLIVADNILHVSVTSLPAVVCETALHPDGSNLYDDYTKASFVPIKECQSMLESPTTAVDPVTFPCSLNQTDNLTNLAYATYAYSVLDEGIGRQTGSFFMDQDEFLSYSEGVSEGSTSDIQVVTYEDPSTNLTHALLFNMTAATPFSSFPNGTDNLGQPVQFFGTDFAASTVSMVTQCVPATQACSIHNVTQNVTDANDFAIPFDCSPIFSGDIWQPPTDGLEQFKGWHSVFFDNRTGVAVNTSTSSQLNPFHFNATAALTSVDFSTLEGVEDPQVLSGAVVDAGHGRVALALTCEATVYNVNYSVVDYRIRYFNAVPADPQLASIVKAPLQVGFGRHELYIQAQIGIMLNHQLTVADHMETAFSQVGIALASGAFDADYSYLQRLRYQTTITLVPAHALWFLVVVCFIYAATGIVFACLAYVIQRDPQCASYQSQLVPVSPLSITETVKDMITKACGKLMDLVNSSKQDSGK